jgi:serine/threonine protein kinase
MTASIAPLKKRGGDPHQIDVRADVYMLGVMLYEMLTERLPYDFERATLPQAIRIICEEAVVVCTENSILAMKSPFSDDASPISSSN